MYCTKINSTTRRAAIINDDKEHITVCYTQWMYICAQGTDKLVEIDIENIKSGQCNAMASICARGNPTSLPWMNDNLSFLDVWESACSIHQSLLVWMEGNLYQSGTWIS